MLGKEFGVEDYTAKLFSEEVLRGSLFFSLSMILKKVDSNIRKAANLGDWLTISVGRVHGSRGFVKKVNTLQEVMYEKYDHRTILIVDKITGEEEVPSNVQAIVLLNANDYPDVLAHVSVRARNLKVMLIICFSEEKSKHLESMVDKHLFLTIEDTKVRYEEASPELPLTRRASSHLILAQAREQAALLESPPIPEKSFMLIEEFNTKNMGAKSNNLL